MRGERPRGRRGHRARLHLLTYGVQLRAYFGRLFPELLGPAVLGTNPVRAPRWTGEQPWRDEIALPPSAPASPSLRTMLDGRWRNLWRLTDLLGFPADSYRTGLEAVDHPAEEFDVSTYVVAVDGHGDYQRTLVYLDELEGGRGVAARSGALPRVSRGSGRRAGDRSGGVPGPDRDGALVVAGCALAWSGPACSEPA